jgi:hypothetical protein
MVRHSILATLLPCSNSLPQAPTAPPPAKAKRPTARQKALERLSHPGLPRKTHRPESAVTDSFSENKRDKRQIRHSAFLSRISERTPASATTRARRRKAAVLSGGISKSRSGTSVIGRSRPGDGIGVPKKKRRPSKKLVATLESLADALPELDADRDGDVAQLKEGKVRHRSLKTRPGALKRKERVIKGELARFGATMAQMAASAPRSSSGSTTQKSGEGDNVQIQIEGRQETAQKANSERWAKLRSFVASTMEVNPAFLGAGEPT